MGAGVEPGKATAHDLHEQLAILQVDAVHVGDLDLAARRGLDRRRDIEHLVVVEIKPGHGVIRLRVRGFSSMETARPLAVELHHPVALRVRDRVAKHRGARSPVDRVRKQFRQAMAMKDVVAENERDADRCRRSRVRR